MLETKKKNIVSFLREGDFSIMPNTIKITCATPDAEIRYIIMDNSNTSHYEDNPEEFKQNSELYTEEIYYTGGDGSDKTVLCKAYKDNMTDSDFAKTTFQSNFDSGHGGPAG